MLMNTNPLLLLICDSSSTQPYIIFVKHHKPSLPSSFDIIILQQHNHQTTVLSTFCIIFLNVATTHLYSYLSFSMRNGLRYTYNVRRTHRETDWNECISFRFFFLPNNEKLYVANMYTFHIPVGEEKHPEYISSQCTMQQ